MALTGISERFNVEFISSRSFEACSSSLAFAPYADLPNNPENKLDEQIRKGRFAEFARLNELE
jgi:hypothetical protein